MNKHFDKALFEKAHYSYYIDIQHLPTNAAFRSFKNTDLPYLAKPSLPLFLPTSIDRVSDDAL